MGWHNAKDPKKRVHPKPMLGKPLSKSHRRHISEGRLRSFAEGSIAISFKGVRTGKVMKCVICSTRKYVYPYRVAQLKVAKREFCCSQICGSAQRTRIGRDKNAGRGIHSYERCKKATIYCHSSWEASFVKLCHKAKFVASVVRPSAWVQYPYKGKLRNYFPDFVVDMTPPYKGCIVEIKNPAFVGHSKTRAKTKAINTFLGKNEFLMIPEKIETMTRLREYLCTNKYKC